MRTCSKVLAAGIVGAATLGVPVQVFTPQALARQQLQPSPEPGGPSSTGGSLHNVATPDRAGGLSRDTQAENQLGQDIAQDRDKLATATNGKFTIVSAFYKDPTETTSDGRPAGVIFIGGTGAPNSIDPSLFVTHFAGSAPNSGTEVPAGPGGGRAACGQDVVRGHIGAYCGWATTDSFGLILPTFDKGIPTVSTLMLRMRPDLEGPAH